MKNKTFDFYKLLKFIKYPLVTSKAYHNYFFNNQYIFIVDRSLTKTQIKYVIEKNYRIGVKNINTAILPTRIKRIGKLIGNQPLYKKVYVRLKARIPFFHKYWFKILYSVVKTLKKLIKKFKQLIKKIPTHIIIKKILRNKNLRKALLRNKNYLEILYAEEQMKIEQENRNTSFILRQKKKITFLLND